jgi:citrate lyase subunit beta/citryl-CoA lyase
VYGMQLAVRLAAAEAGVWACDTVYGAVKDPDGYTREAEAARRLGFIGKSCIHPTQVPLANAVFRPSDARSRRPCVSWKRRAAPRPRASARTSWMAG